MCFQHVIQVVEEDCEIDLSSPNFKQDIVRIVAQYLDDEGYVSVHLQPKAFVNWFCSAILTVKTLTVVFLHLYYATA